MNDSKAQGLFRVNRDKSKARGLFRVDRDVSKRVESVRFVYSGRRRKLTDES